jgi:UTP:GlnB (protein PII) uridylyltransferase
LLGTGAYGYIVEILWHLRKSSLQKEKTNKKMVKTQIMKKTLGTMVAIMAVAISIGSLITAKYATAGETMRDGRFIAYDNGTVLDTSTNLIQMAPI